MTANALANPAEEKDKEPAAVAAEQPAPRDSRLALASLLVALFSIGLAVGVRMPAPLAAGIAVVLGFFGRRAVRSGEGRLSGRGYASWGLRLGVLHLILAGLHTMLFGPLAI